PPLGGAATPRPYQRVAPRAVIHCRPLTGRCEALEAGGKHLVAGPLPPVVPGEDLDFLRAVIARRLDHAAYATEVNYPVPHHPTVDQQVCRRHQPVADAARKDAPQPPPPGGGGGKGRAPPDVVDVDAD